MPSSVNTRNSGSVFTSLTTVAHDNKCHSCQWFSARQESSGLAFSIRLQALDEGKKPAHRIHTAEPQRLSKEPFILAVNHSSYFACFQCMSFGAPFEAFSKEPVGAHCLVHQPGLRKEHFRGSHSHNRLLYCSMFASQKNTQFFKDKNYMSSTFESSELHAVPDTHWTYIARWTAVDYLPLSLQQILNSTS